MSPAVLLAAIAAYLAVVIGLSWRISRRSRGSADFFRGGRKSPWGVVAVAMVSTSISGITFVSVPGMVAASQWSYLQMALGFVAGYAVIAYVLLPLYYRMDLNSLYTWLEARFGRWSHRAGAGFFLLSKVLICGVRMYLTAIVLQLIVFAPLGIHNAIFEPDMSGTPVGSSYLYITAREFASLGQLYLGDGVFQGRRILPEGWVDYTVTPASDSKDGYGSFFWLNKDKFWPDIPEDMFNCQGHDGQEIFIIPSKDLVVVVLGYSPKPDRVVDWNALVRDIIAQL